MILKDLQPFRIYGERAYPMWIHLQASYRPGILTKDQIKYKAMSQVSVTVEWLNKVSENFEMALWHKVTFSVKVTLREKGPNMEFFSGPYFSVFGLNRERYFVCLHIQSECGKIQTNKTPYWDTFHTVQPTKEPMSYITD